MGVLLLSICLMFVGCLGGGKSRYAVSGGIYDANGNGIAGVILSFKKGPEDLGVAETDENGKWVKDALYGSVLVTPITGGYAFKPPSWPVTKKADDVDFIAMDRLELSGVVTLVHSFPLSIEEEAIWRAAAPGEYSRFSLPDLRAVDDSFFKPEYKANELIMRFASFEPEAQKGQLEAMGYEILDEIGVLSSYLVKGTSDLSLARMGMEGLLSIERNGMYYRTALKTPNDAFYSAQWHYNQIRLPQAWAVTTGSRSIRVAVVDSGIDPAHHDLVGQVDLANAADFTSDQTIRDDNGHGTHVAGTIGAASNNGLLVAGVLWDVEILPVKVFRATGGSENWRIVEGMLYAAGLLNDPGKPFNPLPADIINLSLGGVQSSLMEDAVRLIDAAGIIMVAATGNESRSTVSYPAAYPEVIAVGATGRVDKNDPDGLTSPPLARYSNYGPGIDVVAPGGGERNPHDYVWSTYPSYLSASRSAYMGMAGTSMATPHVAGVIGLMLANGIPKNDVREILYRTSMEIGGTGYNTRYGYGLVNAYWAVNDVREMRIIQGIREGNRVTAAAEVKLEPKGGYFTMGLVPGEYQLIAWVDVNQNDIIDAGDYYVESPSYEGIDISGSHCTPSLSEVGRGEFDGKNPELSWAGTFSLVQ